MLIRTQRQYKLSAALKVNKCYQSLDESLVVTSTISPGHDSLFHFCKRGELLFKVDFNDLVDAVTQITDFLFAVAHVELNQIWIIDLIKKKIQVFEHNFIYKVSCQTQIDYFCSSHLLCVRQWGYFGQKLFFTYYQINEEGEIRQYAFYETQRWNPAFQVRKMGSHSKFIWSEDKHANILKAFQLQLEGDKPIFKQMQTNIQSLYINNRYDNIAIIQMWEDYSGKLQIFYLLHGQNSTQIFFNLIVWDTETSQINLSRIQIDEEQIPYISDFHATPSFIVIHSFKFARQRNPIKTPIHYFRNIDGRNVGNEEEKQEVSHLCKYFVSSNYSNQIIKASYGNQPIKNVGLKTISYFDNEEISLALLGRLIPELPSFNDWDYDLLSDIFQMLDYSR